MENTPRDRVLACVNGEEIFPVPFDVIENLIYPQIETSLCQHFGLGLSDHEGVLRALNAHTRWGKPAYIGPPLEEAPFQPPSAFPAKKATRSIWGSWSGMNTYSDEIDRPLKSAETVADIAAHTWPDPDWFDYGSIGSWFEESYLPVSRWSERNAAYARVVGGFGPVFSRIMDLCGMKTGLELIASRSDLIDAMVAHTDDFLEEYYGRIAQAGRGYIDFLAFGDDFAGQGGMMLSPERWRRFFLPVWKRLFAIAHKYGMKAIMHSCGAVRPVLGDLVDAGMDVFQVVQVTAVGMEPAELKRQFGDCLTFYGGMDTQRILPYGTEEEVRLETRRLIDNLGKGGRYILSNAHLLMDDVPVRNVLAMCDEALAYVPGGAVEKYRENAETGMDR